MRDLACRCCWRPFCTAARPERAAQLACRDRKHLYEFRILQAAIRFYHLVSALRLPRRKLKQLVTAAKSLCLQLAEPAPVRVAAPDSGTRGRDEPIATRETLHSQMKTFKMQGMDRLYEHILKQYLSIFPCVAILGPRQCGKTTLLSTLAPNWRRWDLEAAADYDAVATDPDLFLRANPKYVAIDEAQLLPPLFSALRVAIDRDRGTPGRYVLTGSSSPSLVKGIAETLAGRVGIIDMAPLSLREVFPRSTPSLIDLVIQRRVAWEDVQRLEPRCDLDQIMEYWFWGGYPEPWLKDMSFRKAWQQNYVRTYLERDIAKLFPGLDATRYRLFLQMLANLSGTTINYSEVGSALAVSQPTARDYFEIAHGTFFWRRLPAFERDATKRIVKHPRGYVRDTGLMHHLLRIPDAPSLLGHPKVGSSWEGMVIEEIIRSLAGQDVAHDAYYYRTGGGAEIDLIIEGDFGLIPVEIKHTQAVPRRSLRPLIDFMAERKLDLGLVITNDERPRLYAERVFGVPLSYL